MGWQAPSLAPKLKCGIAPLVNMVLGDFLHGVCPGRAGATIVLLLPHAAGVLHAPMVAPFSQLHHAGGHLRPIL
jgi:hypothetical protein